MEINDTENMNENKEEKQKKAKKGDSNIFLRIRWLLFGMIIGFVCCVLFYFGVKTEVNNNQKKPEVNVDYLTGTIREMSDLISAELDFSGVLEYETEEEGILSDLKKDKFLLRYDGEIKAGMDLNEVEISKSDDKILVKMPHAKIIYKKILPDTMKIYDVKKAWAIFGNDKKEELHDAIIKAEKDMDENANMEKLLISAEEQAKKLIDGFIKDVEPNIQVEYTFLEEVY